MDYTPPDISHSPDDIHKLWKGGKKKMRGVDTLPRKMPGVIKAKSGKWIQKAINPAHKGYCTPMTKATCTPRRKALAMRFKHGDLSKK